MIKMPIEDLIYEVKEELLCYEELGEAKALEWEQNFRKWLNDDKIIKKNVKEKKFYCISDESEIFSIADEYLTAVEIKKEPEYWKNFK